MGITVYYMGGSPPCSRVFLTAEILNVELDLKHLDYFKDEHLTPEFLKLNPQHLVPTIVDGDFVLTESRAICRYLVNKYSPGSKLYPQDAQARARVDQRLDFDFGFYETFTEYFYPQFLGGPSPDEAKLKRVQEFFGFLNIFLEDEKYVAGADFTIADCALVSTVANIELANIIDLQAYPNVVRWFNLVKSTVPEYQETVEKHVEIFRCIFVRMSKVYNINWPCPKRMG